MSQRNLRFQRSKGIDWILLLSYLGLVFVGLLMIYTTTYNDYASRGMWSLSAPFGTQFLWVCVSLVFILVASLVDWHIWNTLSLPIYILGILSLIFVLILGTEIKGAKSWIFIGPWSLQPAEFVKLSTAIYCSALLSSIQTRLSEYRSQFFMVTVFALPALLIILQPDPGSAITFGSLLIVYFRFGMPVSYYVGATILFITVLYSLTQGFYFVAAGILLVSILITTKYSKKEPLSWLIIATLLFSNILFFQFGYMPGALILNGIYLVIHLFILNRSRSFGSKLSIIGAIILLGLISFSSSFAFENVLLPHQQDRINVWLQPEKCDPQGSLYNLLQSKLAIGSGGLTGKGFLNGTLTKLNYVPEQTTDFIFSSIGEEQGFIGSIVVVILFLVLTIRIINVGENSKYKFIKAYCYAIAGFLFFHFFINIGMTMGISPVIGIPLPFISKGGSALLSFSLMIGIVLNMSKEK